VDQVVVVVNQINKEIKMKTVNKIGLIIAAAMGLGLTVSYAQPGPMGNGMGQGMMNSQMMQGQMMGPNFNMKVMRELMTPAERLSMMDKMIEAKTPEERQAIMTANRTEMEKRAKEKGITLPVGHGPQIISGKICG
jgi:hypothetical protein